MPRRLIWCRDAERKLQGKRSGIGGQGSGVDLLASTISTTYTVFTTSPLSFQHRAMSFFCHL